MSLRDPPHRRHGNPEDLDAYIAKMEDPSREAWQRPDEVVASVGAKAGDTVADVGAGPGYFSLRLARAVGPRGRVYAVDVVPEMISALRERLAPAGVANVVPILARDGDPLLPPASCEVVLAVNAFHHFPDGAACLGRLAESLKRGGRIAVIDFHRRPTPVGPPVEHRVAREDVLEAVRAAGLALIDEKDFLPHQYFLVIAPR